ncbi:HEAT repeat domain-containing protein [Streptomyces sp. MK5]|uniref:HEAT repeat domain-containing protein n=1 Tax=Streptomyces sp. MK5 TaxID=3064253 RepID=UPI0027427544|nr:HEAT repeat domain-containing protein [Streptomyces sp. MK5]
MTMTQQDTDAMRALSGLDDDRAPVRLRAALAVGTAPEARFVGKLVERCATEPEFFVRDMLTWALTRHPVSLTLPALLRELRSERAQARSQALHTLSEIRDRQAWPAITEALLCDADDEVARSAWRAAVVLVPEDDKPALGTLLAAQLGRGGHDTQLSLSCPDSAGRFPVQSQTPRRPDRRGVARRPPTGSGPRARPAIRRGSSWAVLRIRKSGSR